MQTQSEDTLNNSNHKKILQSGITWLGHMNDTRLYWLWIKFYIQANKSELPHSAKVLNHMQPVTDLLSWVIFVARVGLIKLKGVESELDFHLIRNDLLWGTSNFISFLWLHGDQLRPDLNALAWWGNVCMQALLIADTFFSYQKKQTASTLTLLDDLQEKAREHHRCLSVYYNASLALGFFLFRGFFPILDIVPPSIGAGLCVFSTECFNIADSSIELYKWRNIQQLSAPLVEIAEDKSYELTNTLVKGCITSCLGILLLLLIQSELNSDALLKVIICILTMRSANQVLIIPEKKICLSAFKFFKHQITQEATLMSSEDPRFANAPSLV